MRGSAFQAASAAASERLDEGGKRGPVNIAISSTHASTSLTTFFPKDLNLSSIAALPLVRLEDAGAADGGGPLAVWTAILEMRVCGRTTASEMLGRRFSGLPFSGRY